MAVQVIVPTVVAGRALTARAGGNESDTVLVEGASPNLFDVVGAEFAAGRPFTDVEDRSRAPVAIIGASLATRPLRRGAAGTVDRAHRDAGGEPYVVVGELAPRKGGFFGENRQDSVMTLPVGTARARFPQAENTVLYIRAKPGRRERRHATRRRRSCACCGGCRPTRRTTSTCPPRSRSSRTSIA